MISYYSRTPPKNSSLKNPPSESIDKNVTKKPAFAILTLELSILKNSGISLAPICSDGKNE